MAVGFRLPAPGLYGWSRKSTSNSPATRWPSPRRSRTDCTTAPSPLSANRNTKAHTMPPLIMQDEPQRRGDDALLAERPLLAGLLALGPLVEPLGVGGLLLGVGGADLLDGDEEVGVPLVEPEDLAPVPWPATPGSPPSGRSTQLRRRARHARPAGSSWAVSNCCIVTCASVSALELGPVVAAEGEEHDEGEEHRERRGEEGEDADRAVRVAEVPAVGRPPPHEQQSADRQRRWRRRRSAC